MMPLAPEDNMKTSELFRQLKKDEFLPSFMDQAATKIPDKTFISIPAHIDDVSKGWRDITFSTYARSVEKAATWLLRLLGPSQKNFQPIHFLLPGDLSNSIFVLASWKAGYSGIFCHPEAPAETHESINRVTDCKIVCFSGQIPPKAVGLCSADPTTKIIAAPPLDYWLDGPELAPIQLPYMSWSADKIKNSPLAIVHSSGTTGTPKPITLSHGRFMSMVRSLTACDRVDRLNYEAVRGGRVAILVPATIAAGLFHHFGSNFIYDWTPVLRRMTEPLSLGTLDDMMRYAGISDALTTPKILPGLLQDPELLERFSKQIRSLIYAGAPLPKEVGDVLAHNIKLSSAYGSTETGVYPVYATDPEDWAYYNFDPVFKSALRPIGDLGYHEIVLPRSSDVDGPFQAVFDLYPDIDEWRTKDIFLQHAKKKNLWRYVGRAEDLIGDGLFPGDEGKIDQRGLVDNPFLPNEMEAAVGGNKDVGGAVICQNRAGEIAMVVEPWPVRRAEKTAMDDASKQAFVESIWPTIQAANELCLVPAKIRKELVVVATEPLSRGTKGDPQRPWAQQKYSKAIDDAYTARPQAIVA